MRKVIINNRKVDLQKIPDNQIHLKVETQSRIVFRKHPWQAWAIAVIFGIFFIYSTLSLALVRFGGKPRAPWWMVLLLMFSGFAVLLALYAGQIQTTICDKQLGVIIKQHTSLFCIHKKQTRSTEDLVGVNCFRNALEEAQVTNMNFCVKAEFSR